MAVSLLQVWVAAPYHFACPTVGHDLSERMQADGWRLVWDSAPDDFRAAQVAAQQHGAPVPFCPVRVEPERREQYFREVLGMFDFMKGKTP